MKEDIPRKEAENSPLMLNSFVCGTLIDEVLKLKNVKVKKWGDTESSNNSVLRQQTKLEIQA